MSFALSPCGGKELLEHAGHEPTTSAIRALQWFRRLRIKGPIAGRLYVCYRHDRPGQTATAMTPEGAYNAWQSYWGARP